MSRFLRLTLLGALLLIVRAPHAAAQAVDPALDSLVGLFRDARGSTAILWRPAPGRVAVGFDGAEIRGLSGTSGRFTYGPSFGVATPVQGTILRSGTSLDTIIRREGDAVDRTYVRVPLRETPVSWDNGRARLSGTVILPTGAGPFPSLVMLQGAGSETRESSRVIAYWLAAHDVASLIYDKRSTGGSTGASFNVPFADLARDAIGGMKLLRGMLELRRDRIGLFGPSQGAWIALAATQIDPGIAFLILQSGDATSPLEQEMFRVISALKAERARGVARSVALADSDLVQIEAFRRLKFQHAMTGRAPDGWDAALAAARRASWFGLTGDGLPPGDFWVPNGAFDPMPALLSYRGPILSVLGARDISKDVQRNAAMMRDAFHRSGNARASVLIIENGNHGLFETTTGLPLAVELPNLTRVAPGYLDAILEFLAAVGRDR